MRALLKNQVGCGSPSSREHMPGAAARPWPRRDLFLRAVFAGFTVVVHFINTFSCARSADGADRQATS